MPITKAISSKTNTKQITNADTPANPNQVVTATYGPVTSAAGQTVINMTFAVATANTANFLLMVDGKVLGIGAGNDFTFTNIQSNGTSSQVTLNQALPAGLNIQALYLGVVVPNFSLSTLTASVNALSSVSKNLLLNGNFDFWQRGTSNTIANTASTYVADRWYVKNSLGTSGVITNTQVTGVTTGSLWGNKVQITTAPTAAQTNGCELYQTIENLNTLPLLNKTLSFSVQIKSFNNVNQVGLQLFYNTTESKVTTALGSEQLVSVNSSTFTLGSLLAQNVGTTPTSAGVLGVRIRITGVSTGNTYDINNGFVVEQAMLNVGTTAANFERAGRNADDEFVMCLRYHEAFGSSASTNRPMANGQVQASNNNQFIIPFAVKKRVNAVATCSAASHFNISNATNNTNATAFSDAGSGVDCGWVTFTATSTALNAATFLYTVNTAGRLFFDSEI